MQVEWEGDDNGGDYDHMNPWELYSPGCTADDAVAALKGSQPEVVNACERLVNACTAVQSWVCTSKLLWLVSGSPLLF